MSTDAKPKPGETAKGCLFGLVLIAFAFLLGKCSSCSEPQPSNLYRHRPPIVEGRSVRIETLDSLITVDQAKELIEHYRYLEKYDPNGSVFVWIPWTDWNGRQMQQLFVGYNEMENNLGQHYFFERKMGNQSLKK